MFGIDLNMFIRKVTPEQAEILNRDRQRREAGLPIKRARSMGEILILGIIGAVPAIVLRVYKKKKSAFFTAFLIAFGCVFLSHALQVTLFRGLLPLGTGITFSIAFCVLFLGDRRKSDDNIIQNIIQENNNKEHNVKKWAPWRERSKLFRMFCFLSGCWTAVITAFTFMFRPEYLYREYWGIQWGNFISMILVPIILCGIMIHIYQRYVK